MFYIVVIALIFGLFYTGWKLTSRSAYESAEYTLVESHGAIELRDYPDLMLVTTEMGTRLQGGDGSFGRLFRYISGSNEGKQKVAMTTPVFMAPESEQASGQMGFVIPKDVAAASVPQPTSEQIKITKRLGGRFAVIRFAGRFDEDNQTKQQTKLVEWMLQHGHATTGDPEVASYDPPWTPGPMRRNEILIRISNAQ